MNIEQKQAEGETKLSAAQKECKRLEGMVQEGEKAVADLTGKLEAAQGTVQQRAGEIQELEKTVAEGAQKLEVHPWAPRGTSVSGAERGGVGRRSRSSMPRRRARRRRNEHGSARRWRGARAP